MGNKYATFENGDYLILMNSPHMGFEVSLNYVNKDLEKHAEKLKNAEERHKKLQDEANL